MFIEKKVKPGDYLTVLPFGLPCTIQYGDDGGIQKIIRGFDYLNYTSELNLTDELLHKITSIVPVFIPLKDMGTTWVRGIFYTNAQYTCTEDNIEDSCLSLLLKSTNDFIFYAGDAKNTSSMTFSNVNQIRHWLTMAKFNVLPGYPLSLTMNESQLAHIINNDRFPFKYPLISYYFIHNYGNVEIVPAKLTQFVVSDVKEYLDKYGFLRANLIGESNSLDVSYTDVVKFNINPSTLIVIDDEQNIIYSAPTGLEYLPVSADTFCKCCGKPIHIRDEAKIRCSNTHCSSRMYGDVCRMLKTFDLDEISFEDYLAYVKQHSKIVSLPDILDHILKDRSIEVSLPQILRALISYLIVSNDSDELILFCNKCSHNVETLKYYATHPQDIQSELFISNRKFIEWFTDMENVSDLMSMLDDEKLILKSTDIAFDGPRMFRGKTITILGRCLHGASDVMKSILKSYGADVYFTLKDNSDCVIVGGCHEDVNSQELRLAQQRNLPVFEELDFFKTYDIDADLQSNLN